MKHLNYQLFGLQYTKDRYPELTDSEDFFGYRPLRNLRVYYGGTIPMIRAILDPAIKKFAGDLDERHSDMLSHLARSVLRDLVGGYHLSFIPSQMVHIVRTMVGDNYDEALEYLENHLNRYLPRLNEDICIYREERFDCMMALEGIFGIKPNYLQMAKLDGFATKYGTTKELSYFVSALVPTDSDIGPLLIVNIGENILWALEEKIVDLNSRGSGGSRYTPLSYLTREPNLLHADTVEINNVCNRIADIYQDNYKTLREIYFLDK